MVGRFNNAASHCQSPVKELLASVAAAAAAMIRSPGFQFAAAVAVAFVIFFARSPAASIYPVLVHEDGTWSAMLYKKGFCHSAWHTRPDYLVVGNLVLLWLGMGMCRMVYGGDVFLLPHCYALVSYLFFAIVVSLPLILMRRHVPWPYMVLLWLLSCFMPLGTATGSPSGYEILGRLSNTGYAFLYISFMLAWYRAAGATKPWRFIATDAGLLACALTNPLCMAIVPALAWPIIVRLWCGARPAAVLRDTGTWSLIVLAALSVIPATKVLVGRQRQQNQRIETASAIEIGISRNIIFPVFWPLYSHLNKDRAVAGLALACYAFWRWGSPSRRGFYMGGAALLGLTSVVLVAMRTELGQYFGNHVSTWPDRYFYGQNLVGTAMLVTLAADAAERLRARGALAWLPPCGLATLLGLAIWSEPIVPIAQSQFFLWKVGTFPEAAAAAMERKKFVNAKQQPDVDGEYVVIDIYDPPNSMTLHRRHIEEALAARARMKTP